MAIPFMGLPAAQIDPRSQRLDFSGLNQALSTYREGAAGEARTDHLRKAAALNDPRAQADYLFRAGMPQEGMALGTYPLQRNALMTNIALKQAQIPSIAAQTAARQQELALQRQIINALSGGSDAAPPAPEAMPAPEPLSGYYGQTWLNTGINPLMR